MRLLALGMEKATSAECIGTPGGPRCGATTSMVLLLISDRERLCAIAGLCPLHSMDTARVRRELEAMGFNQCIGVRRDDLTDQLVKRTLREFMELAAADGSQGLVTLDGVQAAV